MSTRWCSWSFKKILQPDKIEEVRILNKIDQEIDVAIRALLLPRIEPKEPDLSDLETVAKVGGKAGQQG